MSEFVKAVGDRFAMVGYVVAQAEVVLLEEHPPLDTYAQRIRERGSVQDFLELSPHNVFEALTHGQEGLFQVYPPHAVSYGPDGRQLVTMEELFGPNAIQPKKTVWVEDRRARVQVKKG